MGIGKILLQTAAGVLATSAIACFMKSAKNNKREPVRNQVPESSDYLDTENRSFQSNDRTYEDNQDDKRFLGKNDSDR